MVIASELAVDTNDLAGEPAYILAGRSGGGVRRPHRRRQPRTLLIQTSIGAPVAVDGLVGASGSGWLHALWCASYRSPSARLGARRVVRVVLVRVCCFVFLVDGSRVSLRVSWWRGSGGIDGVMVSRDLSDEELYGKFSDRLVRFAATVVGAADAEDVMTDGVVGAMQSRQWPTVEDRVSYLYRSVLNAGRMHLRSAKRRRTREARSWSRDANVQGGAATSWIPEPAPEVRVAVASLSARQRAVVYLTYWEDLDEATTARRLGIGVGSVRRHLHRARANIGRQLHGSI